MYKHLNTNSTWCILGIRVYTSYMYRLIYLSSASNARDISRS